MSKALTPRQAATATGALALANIRYWTSVAPLARSEIGRWEQRACGIPDPVLRALATLGATSANATADALRMPLRTVQAVLQQLVAEGACSIERDGRHVAYRIEDTTFSEATTT